MGCKDGFTEASTIVKVAFFVVFVALFCSWISFTTTSWLVGDFHLGLWRKCTAGALSNCGLMDGVAEVEFGVTQAFAIIGFMCQNVAFLLILLFMFKDTCRGNTEVGMASAALLICSAIGWLISVAVFGGEYGDNVNNELHYSFGLAVIACGLGLVGGGLMFLCSGGGGSVGSK